MKVISIIEPWATLIKEGKKCIETRSWKTNYRGEIYIHASAKKISKSSPEIQNLLKLIPNVNMNYGHIICKASLVDCKYMDEEFIKNIKLNRQEYIGGFYSIGRYAWVLQDVKVLKNPIQVKGHLGIWNYNYEESI